MNNKYPHEIETPLDRRAMTIDILAGELERKNKSIKYWKEKAYYHRDYAEKFQSETEELHKRINELEKHLDTQNFYSARLTKRAAKKKRSSKNGKEPLLESDR